MQVIGFSKNEFTPKGESNPILGYNLYLTEKKQNVTGLACERVYLSQKKMDACLNGKQIKIGDEIRLYYNKYGKVEEISIA